MGGRPGARAVGNGATTDRGGIRGRSSALKARSRGSVAVLELDGRFDAYVASQVGAWLDEAAAAPPAQVVLDLSAVTFVDSTALGTMVRGMKRCRQHGGDLHLCGLQRPVRVVFDLTRLDSVFKLFVSQDDAVEAFGGGPPHA